MSRVQSLLCFTILVATATFFNVASAHVKIKPALPQIEDPTTVNSVESYTVKVVSTFVADLEKECPKTEKFKVFFEKLNAYSKYVCPVSKVKDNESDMKAKAGSLFQAIADLDSAKNGSKGGTGNKSLQREKTEAMNTVKMLQSIGEKIAGGESNKAETAKLTVEQQKEIKDGILKWLQVITKIAKTTEEISLKYSSKTHTKRESKESKESKEEKSSTQTQTKKSSRATKAGNNDDLSKSAKKSAKESDNEKKKKGESKKNDGGKGGSQDSASDSTSGDESSTKSKGDAKEKGSSKSKGEKSEKADKNHKIAYGKIEPKKDGAEKSRNKTEERLRAEMADELD